MNKPLRRGGGQQGATQPPEEGPQTAVYELLSSSAPKRIYIKACHEPA